MNTVKALAISASIALGLATVAVAAPKSSPIPDSQRPVVHSNEDVHTDAAETVHKPLGTIDHWSTSSAPLVVGTNNVGALTHFKCKNANGCTVFIANNAQILTSADGGNWAICTEVDGAPANHSCYFQGKINIADSYKSGSDRENVTVAEGNHTIQAQIFLDQPATLGSYQFDYEITTP